MAAEFIAVVTILGMGMVTLVTRLGGFWLMDRVQVTPTLEAFLRALASSVVVAAMAPAAWNGDWAIRLAIIVAAIVMALTRQAWLAMVTGMAAAAGFRFFALA
ncbi:MAG: AzlD family protein [Hyphomicrobiaceae bacterium]